MYVPKHVNYRCKVSQIFHRDHLSAISYFSVTDLQVHHNTLSNCSQVCVKLYNLENTAGVTVLYNIAESMTNTSPAFCTADTIVIQSQDMP